MKRLFAATAMAVVLMTAAPAAAQQYPPSVNSLTITDATPSPGQTVGLEGRTFAAGASMAVVMNEPTVDLGSASADDSGVASLETTIPADTSLGNHLITAVGQAPDGSELSLSVSINVVPADGAATVTPNANADGGSLPRTGGDSLPLANIGLGLAALGGLILAVTAKRRKAATLAA